MKRSHILFIALISSLGVFAEGEPTITAWRNTVNTNDATDFASMYVSSVGTTISEDAEYSTGTISYLWEKSDDGSAWSTYADGLGAKTDNIRPIKGGQYRCTVTLTKADKSKVSVASNAITVTASAGAAGPTISSNIPVISIRTDAADLPTIANTTNAPLTSNKDMFEAKQKRSADCKIIWNGNTKDGSTAIYGGSDFDAANGKLYYDKKIRINYRGSSSMTKPIKNYAFAVGDDNTGTTGKWVKGKEKMFKLSDKKDKDWILYGANDDPTLMRNTLQLNLYEEMTGHWNSHCRYAKLYINGVDKGTYIFMEKNKDGSARIDVEEDGYIFKYDKTDKVDRYTDPETIILADDSQVEQTKSTFISDNSGQLNITTYGTQIDHAFEIVYPEYDKKNPSEWDGKVTVLKNKINAFENALKNNQYASVRSLIDYESFADYFIIQELAKNVDGYRISQFFKIKNASSKIMAEPLWDTELGINNHGSDGKLNTGGNRNTDKILVLDQDESDGSYSPYKDDFPIPFWWIGYTGGGYTGKSGNNSLGTKTKGQIGSSNGLMGDDCFKAKIKQRWAKHTAAGGPITQTNIENKLNTYATSVGGSVNSVFSSWFFGDNGRINKLGAIINGWTVSDFASNVTSSFQDAEGVTEEGNVLTKSVPTESEVTMVASATAEEGATLYYSWQYSEDGETWTTVVDDSTDPEYTVTVMAEGYYKAKAKSGECDCMKYDSNKILHLTTSDVIINCK